MKKYFLLLWLALGSVSFIHSQSLQLSDSTGPIINNATIYQYGLKSADEIVSHVFIMNPTVNRMQVKVKKVEISTTPETANLFCWGLCYSPEIFVSPDSVVIDGGATNSTDFSGHYLPQGVDGITTIRYVFFDLQHPSDTVCVNISYDTYPAGINHLSAGTVSDAYPNPAGNAVSFNYSNPPDQDANIIIRNVLGSVVKQASVPGSSGKLNIVTADLADGVYFYSYIVNGTTRVTKKLIVRH